MLNYRNRHKDFHYKQLQLGKDSDDDDVDETELFVRKTPFKEIPTEEKIVEEGDTLQSISIRYHCPIAEIKRLNNIHKENEIFARNTIKVPARPFTKILAGVHTSGKSSPETAIAGSSKVPGNSLIDTTLLEDKLINLNSNADPISHNLNTVIFNSNVNKTCDIQAAETVDDIADEEVQLLPNIPRASIDVTLPAVSRMRCSGADADISWIALILCVVILIVAVPLIYVYYIAEHPEAYHHVKHVNST